MGIITSVVLGLTLVGMLLGALFGFLRGRERAILRLVLVVLSAVLALVSRGAILDALMKINIGGAPLSDTITQAFQGGTIPQSLQSLILSLVEILVGIISYFIMLFAFRFFTWALVFPFLKLIIRKFENVRAEKLYAESLAQSAKANEENVCFDTVNVAFEEEIIKEPKKELSEDLIIYLSNIINSLEVGVLVEVKHYVLKYECYKKTIGIFTKLDKVYKRISIVKMKINIEDIIDIKIIENALSK